MGLRASPAVDRPTGSAAARLLPIAGGALIAGPLLYVAGMATSPPADSMAAADYVASLARDEGQTALSALLLHYGNLLHALAWLAAPALVRGRRGGTLTVVGALLSALGLVSVTGLVLSDFWTGAIGRELDPATAEALFTTVESSAGMGVVGTLTLLGLIGPVVALAGLARDGVIGWWLLAPAVAALVLSMALPFQPLLFAAFALVGAAPTVVVGLRLLQRSRAGAV
ncbi:hypothetical protein [Modestobacter marinus]|uniref:hypothetical protein n=1 Tax=Modestobacter marinus TaxID=477641 RepID=UPI00201B2F75|nr:hypothetical protein [Modestobacter marinus]